MFIVDFLKELPSSILILLFLFLAIFMFAMFGRIIHIKAGGVELKSFPSGRYVSFSANRFSLFSVLMLLFSFMFSIVVVNRLCSIKQQFLEKGQILDSVTDTLIVGAVVYIEGGESTVSNQRGEFEIRVESTSPRYSWLGCGRCDNAGIIELKIFYDGHEESYHLPKPFADARGETRKEFIFPDKSN
jgi:hypothetical protein